MRYVTGVSSCVLVMLIMVLGSLPVCTAAESLMGKTRSEVIAAKGEPDGRMQSGDTETLSYQDGTVILTAGIVTSVHTLWSSRTTTNPAAVSSGDSPRPAKGKGETPALRAPLIKKISNGGASIDMASVLVKGKVTIVDFYADWCGPCRHLGPYLEKLVQSNRDIYLRQIDIVNWNTPVVKQYEISSVPHVRVYDASGRMVGQPTHDYNAITKNVAKAQGKKLNTK